jgi:hypothetical protein
MLGVDCISRWEGEGGAGGGRRREKEGLEPRLGGRRRETPSFSFLLFCKKKLEKIKM